MWDEKQLMKEIDDYFDSVTEEKLMKDIEKADCLSYLEEEK